MALLAGARIDTRGGERQRLLLPGLRCRQQQPAAQGRKGDKREAVNLGRHRWLSVSVAWSRGDLDHERDTWPLFEVAGELARRDREDFDRLQRGDRAQPRLVIEKRQLAEDLARPADAEQSLLPIIARGRDLDPSGKQHQDTITRIALIHQHRGPRDLPALTASLQGRPVLGLEQRREAVGLHERRAFCRPGHRSDSCRHARR